VGVEAPPPTAPLTTGRAGPMLRGSKIAVIVRRMATIAIRHSTDCTDGNVAQALPLLGGALLLLLRPARS
jgi:hypothetical protein